MKRMKQATQLMTLAQQLHTKKRSPVELVQETIQNIERINPTINALANNRFEKALHEAKTNDYTQTVYGGIPILLKDLGQSLAGEYNTAGSKLLQHYKSTQTDYFTQRLLNLGFIVIGQTTTCEFGFKNYTQSELYGVTKNPKDTTRHAGGSSGGAAAAVASQMVPIASASDGGGSIRIPASWTGLIGLKATRGRMAVGPSSYRGWQGASSHFVYTNHLQDIENLFYQLQVLQMDSPFPLPLAQKTAIRPLKIGYTTESPVGTPVSQEAKQAVACVVKQLSLLGHDVIETPWAVDGQSLIEYYYTMNSVETVAMFNRLETFVKRPIEKSDVELQTWLIYEAGKHVTAAHYSQLLDEWDKASAQMHRYHEQFDIFVTPTTSQAAPLLDTYGVNDTKLQRHALHVADYSPREKLQMVADIFSEGLEKTPFNFIFNITGQPSLSLPLYETRDGLPLGVQFSAKKGEEPLLFALAKQLEPWFK